MRTTIFAPMLAAVSNIADRDIIHRFFDGVKTVTEALNISADDKRLALTAPEADLRLNINSRLVYALGATERGFQWGFMLRVEDLRKLKPDLLLSQPIILSEKTACFGYTRLFKSAYVFRMAPQTGKQLCFSGNNGIKSDLTSRSA